MPSVKEVQDILIATSFYRHDGQYKVLGHQMDPRLYNKRGFYDFTFRFPILEKPKNPSVSGLGALDILPPELMLCVLDNVSAREIMNPYFRVVKLVEFDKAQGFSPARLAKLAQVVTPEPRCEGGYADGKASCTGRTNYVNYEAAKAKIEEITGTSITDTEPLSYQPYIVATPLPVWDNVWKQWETALSCKGCGNRRGVSNEVKATFREYTVEGAYEKEKNDSYRALSCKGCVNNGIGHEVKTRLREYTEETFLDHFEQCKDAQKLWELTLAGKRDRHHEWDSDAGVCGIVRTVALDGLNAQEYIHDTVPMLIWSATESTVTIMCSSIPVLRPLYVRLRYGSKNDSSSAGQDSSSYKLPMYGNNSPGKYGLGSTPGIGAKNELDASHRTVITYNADNASDESILPDTKVQGINETGAGIRRIDRVDVRYEVYPEQKQ
ncbi:hypothetical protein GE09DRAFT_1231742 [Coniochaeta sp. 2T2.1]|nr:hypothetical protein GE09DRAFT_1231742 [Coniochaeta sp. 2T2.1]